jgi:hypothetical protein
MRPVLSDLPFAIVGFDGFCCFCTAIIFCRFFFGPSNKAANLCEEAGNGASFRWLVLVTSNERFGGGFPDMAL